MDDDRTHRIDAIVSNCQEAEKAGKRVSYSDTIARHPDLSPELEQALNAARPRRVGPYIVYKPPLGSGGFGTVYKARHAQTGHVYALKVLKSEHRRDPTTLRRFEREAELVQQLNHGHIVRVVDVVATTDSAYIVMDLIDGETLSDVHRDLSTDLYNTLQLFLPIVYACAHAHSVGVIHRDIKPSNILWDVASKKMLLADLGQAKHLTAAEQLTISRQPFGTPGYMAPEQVAGDSKSGPHTDIFSLGATLYFILTGQAPFPTDPRADLPPHAICDQTVHDEPVRPRVLNEAVPDALEVICLRCLEKRPEDRYPTANALAADLFSFLASASVAAKAPGLVGKWRRWNRRSKGYVQIVAICLIALMLATVAGVYFGVRDHRKSEVLSKLAGEAAQARLQREEAVKYRQWSEYTSDMRAAEFLWKEGQVGRLRETLKKYSTPESSSLRGIEWHYWNHLIASSGVRFRCREACKGIALSPDSAFVAAVDSNSLIVWHIEERRRCAFEGIVDAAPFDIAQVRHGTQRVSFSPDGSLVAGVFATRYVERDSKKISVVDATTLQVLDARSGVGRLTAFRLTDMSDGAVVFSPDGSRVLVGGHGADWRVWDVDSRTEDVFRSPKAASKHPAVKLSPNPPTSPPERVTQMRFVSQDSLMTCANGRVECWNWQDRTPQNAIAWPENSQHWTGLPNGIGVPYSVVADNTRIVLKADDRLVPAAGPQDTECFCTFGAELATVGADHILRVWGLPKVIDGRLELLEEFRGNSERVTSVCLNDTHVVAGDINGTVIIWKRHEPVAVESLGLASVSCPVTVVEPEGAGEVRILGTTDRALLLSLPRSSSETQRLCFSTNYSFVGVVSCPTIHGDPKLNTPQDKPCLVSVYNLRTGERVAEHSATRLDMDASIVFSGDERVAVCPTTDGSSIVQLDTGKTKALSYMRHAIALSKSGRYVGLSDRSFSVQDLDGMKAVLNGSGTATSITFGSDEHRVFVSGRKSDRCSFIAELSSRKELSTEFGSDPVQQAVFSEDGSRLFARQSGRLMVYAIHQDAAVLVLSTQCSNWPKRFEDIEGVLAETVNGWAGVNKN